MSKITCKKCAHVFESFNADLAIESFMCPQCGMDNKKTEVKPDISGREAEKAEQSMVPSTPQGSQEGNQSQEAPSSNRSQCEWETGWKTNFLNSYVNTVKQVIVEPGKYFGTIEPMQDYFGLAVFIFINSFITILFSMLFQILFSAAFDPSALIGLPMIFCVALFMPIVAVGMTFVMGAILHLCYTMIGGSTKDFETTMTVYGLSSAANLFGIVPFIGGMASLVYFFIINIAGQAEAHEITTGKAAWSLILPMLVLCCCVFTGIVGVISLAGGIGAVLENLGQ